MKVKPPDSTFRAQRQQHLNRVISGNPSAILGNLISNGKLLLINQNGILVGPGGTIDAFGGFIGSTLDIDDNDFLNGGDDVFMGTSAAGITNFGTIVSGGGDVILLGNFIDNQGTIGAVDGTIALGAGGDILVSQAGEAKISIRAGGAGGNVGINNTGDIRGGSVELKAHGNVYAQAINNSGMIRATGATTDANGRVTLSARSADGNAGGSIVNTGEIRANNADGSGGFIMVDAGGAGSQLDIDGVVKANGLGDTPGGSITLLGESISLGSNADVSANGSEGGAIIIGSADETNSISAAPGSKVSANGSVGNGGSVILAGNSESVLTLNGTIEAKGATTGGFISATGGSVTVGATGLIDASGGVDGGFVSLEATNGVATINGTVLADGGSGNGGFVSVTGSDGVTVGPNGLISASGAVDGGQVLIDGGDGEATINGTVNANGTTGNGGQITINAEGGVSIGTEASVNANGGVNGGLIDIDSGAETYVAGSINAIGGSGVGGRVNISGEDVVLAAGAASVNVDGGSGGGQIAIGGSFQGSDDPNVRNSESTQVGRGVTLSANALNTGNAGQVVVWSDGDTIFNGDILAQGLGEIGNGGLVEVSGKRNLTYRGNIDATSVNGSNGSVLFDPGDITIGNNTGDLFTADINNLLQLGTNVIIATDNSDGANGSILIQSNGEGDNRNNAIQWNTSADLGLFAAGNITVLTHVRNAGSGSVNLIAGWDGLESDLPGFTFGDNFPTTGAGDFTGIVDVETIYDGYVAGGQFGSRGGTVFLNDITNNSPVIVGSRFGETNVAAQNLIMQGGNGNARITQLGFYDSGLIFDSHRADFDDAEYAALLAGDRGPLVADITRLDTYGFEGGNAGVYFTDGYGGAVGSTGSFVPFHDHMMRLNFGNWWWRSLVDTTDLRGNALPESGAGSAADFADINVELKGSLVMQFANDDGAVQIGHGGNASVASGAPGRSWTTNRFGGQAGDGDETRDFLSVNLGDGENTYNNGIARNAPIYSDISINAGGLVQMEGGTNRPIMIGHLGTYQVGGEVQGDITVAAGADVSLQAGGGWNGYATIGHHKHSNETNDDSSSQLATLAFHRDAGGVNDELNNTLRGPALWTNFVGDITVTSKFGSVIGRGSTAGQGTGAGSGNTQSPFPPFTGDPINDVSFTDAVGIDFDDNDFGQGRGEVQIGHGATDVGAARRTNLVGDITVLAGVEGDDPYSMTVNNGSAMVDFEAGNMQRAFAMIGHGGANVSDERSSDYTAGDIRVQAGGNVRLSGTTTQVTFPMTFLDAPGNSRRGTPRNYGDLAAFAQIGHGGLESDNQYSAGDILVTAQKDVLVRAGTYDRSYAMIGHGGFATRGQIGGVYNRSHDGIDHSGAGGTRSITFTDSGSVGGVGAFLTGQELQLANRNGDAFGNLAIRAASHQNINADIHVVAGGGVTLTHVTTTYERDASNPTGGIDDPLDTDPSDGIDRLNFGRQEVGNTFAHIGHGGYSTIVQASAGSWAMPNQQFTDKIGSIDVQAQGDVLLEGGRGNFVSTAIGSREVNSWSRSLTLGGQEFVGDISVTSTAGNVILDNSAGGENYLVDPSFSLADPANYTPNDHNNVAIGHGGSHELNQYRAKGDISIDSALDTTLIAGAGLSGSFTQVGHGYFDPANSNSAHLTEKHVGDITLKVGGDLTLTANGMRPVGMAGFDASNPEHVALLRANGGTNDPSNGVNALDIFGAFSAIGHGGLMVEGDSSGDIDVSVQGDLRMISARRDTSDATDTGTGPSFNYMGFTQIGHFGPESGDAVAPFDTNYANDADFFGDITVQVGGDFTQLGGASPGTNNGSDDAALSFPVILAYSQIGHGGMNVDGIKDGTIDVTVGGNYTGTGGQFAPGNLLGNTDNNNYVMIGHGDWERVPGFEAFSGFPQISGSGPRIGDVYVKIGESATLDRVLIGHADFNTQSSLSTIAQGNTYFGVSRNNPFQSTGTGELVARNGSVFSSAFYGFGSELRIYVPKRELNKMERDTTLNSTSYASGTPGETSSGSGGVSFVQPFVIDGEMSGRADELYLNPDLWLEASDGGGVDFVPGDLARQGSVANVADPGDLPSLISVADNGQLGEASASYVGGNGLINGITNYTIYYDAINEFSPSALGSAGGGGAVENGSLAAVVPEIVPFAPTLEEPIVIVTPFAPFDFVPFVDFFKFEQFDQQGSVIGDLIQGDAADGGGVVAGTANGDDDEENRKRSRYRKQVANWNTYYRYDFGVRRYCSFSLFGTSE